MGWLCQLISVFEARARAPATGPEHKNNDQRLLAAPGLARRADNPDLALHVRVLSVVQTCDGWTENDQLILVRFRYGRLWIGLTPDFKTTPITLFVTPYGRVDDGYLAFETLRTRTAGVVKWPS